MLESVGVGMSSKWGKLILEIFVKKAKWKANKKPKLINYDMRMWLWKTVGLGVELQKILRNACNSMMTRVKDTVGEIVLCV